MLLVTAALILQDHKILIARRGPNKHLSGKWEFPGGKSEPGESDEICLRRELLEEMGIIIEVGQHFLDSPYKYPEKEILLKSYFCTFISGEIVLTDHDQNAWVTYEELSGYDFAPADIPIVLELQADQLKFNRITYSLKTFLEVDIATWGKALVDHHLDCMGELPGRSQKLAWIKCFEILQREVAHWNLPTEMVDHIYIVFEYELPRERGRRPDILILSGDNLLVLEFKGYERESQSQIDQAKHYARDLSNYHEGSHHLNVIPILVLASASDINKVMDGVQIVSGDCLGSFLLPFITSGFSGIRRWFFSDYAPLPTLIESAQMLFKGNNFPSIKRAASAGIPQTLAKLLDIAREAESSNSHHLALITGVPGAGKTLVGLQFVFDTYQQLQTQKAVFLSGNGPLVDVLQYSLSNRNFVQSVHGFLKQYAKGPSQPTEHVMIYDEAQRAWDEEKVIKSGRGSNSEPKDFITIGGRKTWCLLIGLIGEGQEIYLGEEGGIGLWVEALSKSTTEWQIHCPDKLINYFADMNPISTPEFNLTESLRTHQASTLQRWVDDVLENVSNRAIDLAKSLFDSGYPLYITRDLSEAKQYVNQKYECEPNKTFGLMASSKSQVLPKFGMMNDYNSSKAFQASQYYADPGNSNYCRNLTATVTEFACQGLELDFPIIGWELDWIYNGGWQSQSETKGAKDSFKLRKNSYRVLLTRGRDGLIIFVPAMAALDSIYAYLLRSGCRKL